ncbi:MAG: hypothetical protein OCC46_11900 [Pseudodesulfovibrio sp.]
MDDATRETIYALAKEHGLDPKALEVAFASGGMSEELVQAMGAILGDVELFSDALSKLDK